MTMERDDTMKDDHLMQQAAQLATGIAPERDLWPAIDAALDEARYEAIAAPQRSRSWTPYLAQAAAVVLLIAASSSVTYMMTKEDLASRVVPPPQVANGLDFEFISFGSSYTLGQGFQDARSNLAAQLDIELDRLAPEARTGVEENLAVIRAAISEINEALETEPDNFLLQELLLKSYREELTVMRKVGSLTQHVLSRNDI